MNGPVLSNSAVEPKARPDGAPQRSTGVVNRDDHSPDGRKRLCQADERAKAVSDRAGPPGAPKNATLADVGAAAPRIAAPTDNLPRYPSDTDRVRARVVANRWGIR